MHTICVLPTWIYVAAFGLVVLAAWLLLLVARDWKDPHRPRFGRIFGALIALAAAAPEWGLIWLCW